MDALRTWKSQEAADYLSGIRGAQHRIQALAATIAETYREIDGIRGIDYASEHVASGSLGDAMERLISDKEERMAECQRQAHELELKVRRAVYYLGKMEDQSYAAMLEGHYINGRTWCAIARDMCFSESRIYDLRASALEQFHDVMSDRDTLDIPEAI